MSYESVLGIDLGASYTKVSIRVEQAQPNAHCIYTRFVGQMPTLGIRDNSRGTDSWYFGEQAANLEPGSKARIYENWKAKLSLIESGRDTTEAVIVGFEFFKSLRKWLKTRNIDPDAQRVRVCVPALEHIEPYASTLAQIMDAAGWQEAVQIVKVSEPRANAVGIMSGGRNCILITEYPGYGQMFEQSLYTDWVYRALHEQRPPIVKICILDVGSFTTDIAGISMNLQAGVADGISTSLQKSWRHGVINELDAIVFPKLCDSYGIAWNSIKFTEREEMKKRLYAGKEFGIAAGTIGGKQNDQKLITGALESFCTDLWAKVKTDVVTFNPEFCFLTGGGNRIASIRQKLTSLFQSVGSRVIPVPDADPLSTDEPAEMVATALGAASIILDAEEPNPGQPIFEPKHGLATDEVYCRCNGGNKDCCRCFGRGYYRKIERF
ncbi:MAG TPA: hypothetical protein VG733_19680 [Chthoniobacteraceae bacterium]|nr:hypothetical protein [Chthoniobacteraceae bacterium]